MYKTVSYEKDLLALYFIYTDPQKDAWTKISRGRRKQLSEKNRRPVCFGCVSDFK